MGRKNKLKKFAEITKFNNVFEAFELGDGKLYKNFSEKIDLKGKWRKEYFRNKSSIVLELACGKGEYTNAMAGKFPDKNFVGVDIKGNRIWKGAVKAREDNLLNVAFLRTRIEYLDSYFESGEVNEIWITFPDPFVKPSKANRRLTSLYFLDKYKNITSKDARFYLKTDDTDLYNFTIATVQSHPEYRLVSKTSDVYSGEYSDILGIKTYYERKHLLKGKKIKFIEFTRQ